MDGWNEVEKLNMSTHVERTAVSTWVMHIEPSIEVGDLTKVAANGPHHGVVGKGERPIPVFDQKAAVLPTWQLSSELS